MMRAAWWLAFLFGLSMCGPASAQTPVRPCTEIPAESAQVAGNSNCQNTSKTFPLPVTGNSAIPTYSGATSSLAVAGAGDVYCIQGSATKTVKVKRIGISGIASSAVVIDAEISVRSTIDAGGTGQVITLVPSDPGNAAGSAAIETYTANPTQGTIVGPVRSMKVALPTSAGSGDQSVAQFDFTRYWDQPLILRAATQAACLSVSTVGAGGSLDIDSEHTEEPVGYQ